MKNTSDLRKKLALTLEQVSSGDLTIEQGLAVTKVAAQINESFYSEVKVAALSSSLGRYVTKLGDLKI